MNLTHLADTLSQRGHGYADGLRRTIDHGGERARAGLHEARSFAGSRAGLALGATAAGIFIGLLLNPARKVAWQGHEALAGDWVGVLTAEHRMVQAAFEVVLATDSSETAKRAALLKKINWALLKHGAQEETVVYPALRDAATEEERAKHLYEDHADIKTWLYQLQKTPKDDPAWLETMGELRDLVEKHIREEEEEVFPEFHARLSRAENRRLTLNVHREGVRLA